MLIFGVFFLAALAATLTCGLSGAFSSCRWLWLLPVSVVGYFLIVAAIVFLIIWLMAKAVDQEKPQESDSRLYRILVELIAEAAVPILGLRMQTEGLEKIPQNGRFLLVCNHLDNLDPIVLLHHFRGKGLAFIAKREAAKMFLAGPIMHKIMAQYINRENDREALKTILNCVRLIREDKASIAVFPEGYIKPDRKLHRFRSGVLKIAQKTKVPIVVCTLLGTNHIMENFKHFRKTSVRLHLVDVIEPESYEGITTVELGNRIFEIMAQDLGPENVSADVQ